MTSSSFLKTLAGRLTSTIACTIVTHRPHMMAYVSRFIEESPTAITPVTFRVLIHSELSNLPLTCTQIKGAACLNSFFCIIIYYSDFCI